MSRVRWIVGAVSLSLLWAAFWVMVWPSLAHAQEMEYEQGKAQLMKMQGCYLVDYSYVETESLREGYERDPRVYDVNRDKSVKEWIEVREITTHRVRLQHILFATDLQGQLISGTELKHQAEDWEYEALREFEFIAPQSWKVKTLGVNTGMWTRRVTGLDDGLRYQCTSRWDFSKANPEWSCDNFAPIPGRETRDMERKDYNTLDRSTRIVAYPGNWLERQTNVKTIFQNGTKTQLARESGKNWYVRLPDSECQPALNFQAPRKMFWELLRETWDDVFASNFAPNDLFVEKSIPGSPSRYIKIMQLEEQSLGLDLNDPKLYREVKTRLSEIIEAYRAR